ncbi:MAG: metallophosphoesterase family protein [Chloroflexota bacterium]
MGPEVKIGLIADTHIPLNVRTLPPQLPAVFAGVRLILHAGDIYAASALDELAAIAPVYAAYGDGDARQRIPLGADPRLEEKHVIDIDGLAVGLVHSLRLPSALPEKIFRRRVDLVVCGHTHQPGVREHQGTIIVNPGSATLPNHQLNQTGTVGLLDIDRSMVKVSIIPLDGNRPPGVSCFPR